jgi:hypothetical protein
MSEPELPGVGAASASSPPVHFRSRAREFIARARVPAARDVQYLANMQAFQFKCSARSCKIPLLPSRGTRLRHRSPSGCSYRLPD